MPELVFTADADGVLVFRNRRWLEYTGGRAAPPGFEDLIEADDLSAFLTAFSAARAGARAFESELRFKGGAHPRWHLMRVVPTRSSDGVVSGWVGTGTDIDSQKRDQRSLAMLASFTRVLGELTEGATELDRALGCALPVLGDALLLDWRPEDAPARRVTVSAPGARVPALDDARLDLAPSTVAYTGRSEVHLDLDGASAVDARDRVGPGPLPARARDPRLPLSAAVEPRAVTRLADPLHRGLRSGLLARRGHHRLKTSRIVSRRRSTI